MYLLKKNIYNAKQTICRKAFGPLSSIQYLLKAWNDDHWLYKYETTSISKELTRLLFIEKNTVNILKENSEVLLIDYTYKTNRSKFLLLVIMGHTALGTTFYVRFVFLANQKNQLSVGFAGIVYLSYWDGYFFLTVIVMDCNLALINALATVFPLVSYLLYVWHINKNVLANYKTLFETKRACNEFYVARQAVVYINTLESSSNI